MWAWSPTARQKYACQSSHKILYNTFSIWLIPLQVGKCLSKAPMFSVAWFCYVEWPNFWSPWNFSLVKQYQLRIYIILIFLTGSASMSEGWLCWGLTSQSTIFQSCRDGAIASRVINQYFRGVKCLAQGHNTAAVGLEPRTSRSGVWHSTTEPPRSPHVRRICKLFWPLYDTCTY